MVPFHALSGQQKYSRWVVGVHRNRYCKFRPEPELAGTREKFRPEPELTFYTRKLLRARDSRAYKTSVHQTSIDHSIDYKPCDANML